MTFGPESATLAVTVSEERVALSTASLSVSGVSSSRGNTFDAQVGTERTSTVAAVFADSTQIADVLDADWVQNAYRWVVWHHACVARSFPEALTDGLLTASAVEQRLLYRYQRETRGASRPFPRGGGRATRRMATFYGVRAKRVRREIARARGIGTAGRDSSISR